MKLPFTIQSLVMAIWRPSVSNSPRCQVLCHFGYYTITLPSRVHLHRGDDFAIVVKFTTPDTQHPLAVECLSKSTHPRRTRTQEGYVSTDGEFFTDITAIETLEGHAQTSICIKGLTAAPSGSNGQTLPSDLLEVAALIAPLNGLASGSKGAQDRQLQTVQQLGLPLEAKTRQTGIVFRLVPPGTFTMGSPYSEAGWELDEGPQHQVTLTKAFYCSKSEITQGQWQQVMGTNPSYFKSVGLNAPVEQVSWDDCQVFVKKLCQRENVAEGTYRLLTEAEWDYACRAVTTSVYCFGDNDSVLGQYAWYGGNSGDQRIR